VRFVGYVPTEELPRYYQSCDVFCAPNTGQESFGIVLLEAMAAGAPIVASSIPGYRDVLSDGSEGLFVPPKDPQAIASALCRLLNDAPLRARLGYNGQQKARGFDWTRVADQVLAYYDDVLERQAREPEPQRASFARRMAGLLTLRV
jgi:phosphatidylinositol alpha-mannosyltransferase